MPAILLNGADNAAELSGLPRASLRHQRITNRWSLRMKFDSLRSLRSVLTCFAFASRKFERRLHRIADLTPSTSMILGACPDNTEAPPGSRSSIPIASRRKRLRPGAVVGYNLIDRHPDEPHLPHTNLRHRVAPRNARQPYRREALHVSAPRCPRGIRLPLRLGVLR
jgi:hypothetical protein